MTRHRVGDAGANGTEAAQAARSGEEADATGGGMGEVSPAVRSGRPEA